MKLSLSLPALVTEQSSQQHLIDDIRQVTRRFHSVDYLRCCVSLRDDGFAVTSSSKETFIFLKTQKPAAPPYQVRWQVQWLGVKRIIVDPISQTPSEMII